MVAVAGGRCADLVGVVASSGDGSNWSQATSAMDGGNVFGVTYGGGLFVATGIAGGPTTFIMTSANGSTWSGVTTGQEANFPSGQAAAYGNGIWLVVGYNGGGAAVFRSTNGTTWTAVTSAYDSYGYNDIAFDPVSGQFVATVGSGGPTLVSSSDGLTWSAVSGRSDFAYRLVATAGKIVVVGQSGVGAFPIIGWANSIHGPWTYPSTPLDDILSFGVDVDYSGGRWVALVDADTLGPGSISSTDLSTWTAAAITRLEDGGIAWMGSFFLAAVRVTGATSAAGVYKSSDGLAWTQQTSPFTSGQGRCIAGTLAGGWAIGRVGW